jgi:hypothetical protein
MANSMVDEFEVVADFGVVDDFQTVDEDLDTWVESFDENKIDELCTKSWLLWKEGAGTQFRKVYDGTGRSSMFAKRAEKKGKRAADVEFSKITNVFRLN